MTDRFEQITVHNLDAQGRPTGEVFYVVLDHVKRLARRYDTREAAARSKVLPLELVESIDPGDAKLYAYLAAQKKE